MQVWVVVAVLAGVAGAVLGDVPCVNVDSQLTLPCLCKSRSGNITINCDNVAFPGDFPLLPFKMNIVEFTQRNAGIQALRGQLFTASDLPLRKVDFSRNAIRRLNMDVLEGLESHLLELHLDHNLLGNNFNPSFSFSEVAKLTALQVDEDAFDGLSSLETLHLDDDNILSIPWTALAKAFKAPSPPTCHFFLRQVAEAQLSSQEGKGI